MQAELHPITDHAEGLRLVETGDIDAYFGDQSILFALLESSAMKDQLTVAGNTLTLELHGLALPLGDHRFRLEIDRALSELYRAGRMADVFQMVFPNAEPGDSIRYIHTFAPVIP
jgi:ABC-type amino acid transport substrate-binding protein